MLIPNYQTFRTVFAGAGTYTDGLPNWIGSGSLEAPVVPPIDWAAVFPISISLPGSTNEWHWYLCVPNEGSSAVRLELYTTDSPVNRNMTIRLTTAGATEKLAMFQAGVHPRDIVDRFVRGVHVFAYNVNDTYYYACDLHRAIFAPASF